MVSCAERGASGLRGLPMKVSSASVLAIQCIICSCDTRYVEGYVVSW